MDHSLDNESKTDEIVVVAVKRQKWSHDLQWNEEHHSLSSPYLVWEHKEECPKDEANNIETYHVGYLLIGPASHVQLCEIIVHIILIACVYLVDKALFTNVLFLAWVPLIIGGFTKKFRGSGEIAVVVELIVSIVLPYGK